MFGVWLEMQTLSFAPGRRGPPPPAGSQLLTSNHVSVRPRPIQVMVSLPGLHGDATADRTGSSPVARIVRPAAVAASFHRRAPRPAIVRPPPAPVPAPSGGWSEQ